MTTERTNPVTIDYSSYGIDIEDAVTNQRKAQTFAAEIAATQAEIDADVETDPEDKAILAERATVARSRAEALRTEAKLTKRETREQRVTAMQSFVNKLVNDHVAMETERRRAEAAGADTSEIVKRMADKATLIGTYEARIQAENAAG